MQIVTGVETIIYAYVLLCLLMLFGNLFYLLFAQYRHRWNRKQMLAWQLILAKQLSYLTINRQKDIRHEKYLVRKLAKTSRLILYSKALKTFLGANGKVQEYLDYYQPAFQKLARIYAGKNNTQKAYFADFIAENPPHAKDGTFPVAGILVEYLEHCDRFCRENVVRSLASLGCLCMLERAAVYGGDTGDTQPLYDAEESEDTGDIQPLYDAEDKNECGKEMGEEGET